MLCDNAVSFTPPSQTELGYGPAVGNWILHSITLSSLVSVVLFEFHGWIFFLCAVAFSLHFICVFKRNHAKEYFLNHDDTLTHLKYRGNKITLPDWYFLWPVAGNLVFWFFFFLYIIRERMECAEYFQICLD